MGRSPKTTIPDLAIEVVEMYSPDPVCDRCIQKRLGLKSPSRVNWATHGALPFGRFKRGDGVCSSCGISRKVSWIVKLKSN